MSKPWFASFKRAAASVGASVALGSAIAVLASPAAVPAARAARTRAPTAAPTGDSRSESSPRGDAPALADSLPERDLALSDRGGNELTVGDTVGYSLVGGDAAAEARWSIDPRVGGLAKGFLFRPGRLFTPLAAGRLSLPALPIVDEKGEVVGRTKPLEFGIRSNFTEKELGSPEPPKPAPALGPLGLPFPMWIQSAIATGVLVALVVGVFLVLRYLRRKAAAALKKLVPKKPYDVAALDRLDALLKAGHLEKGAFKPFYFGLSETLKFYYGERFDFDAQESTTSELIALLRERNGTPGLNDGVIRKTQNLFESLDPVKFADRVPSAEEAREVHRIARELVTTTRKVSVDPIAPAAPRKEAR